MATEAEWQAALEDLKVKRKAFLAAGEAYAEAEKLVDALYMTPQAHPVPVDPKCGECGTAVGMFELLCSECKAVARANMLDWMRRAGP